MAMKLTFLFLNLGKIQIFIPKSTEGGEGGAGLGIIPKKTDFLVLPLFHLMHNVSVPPCLTHSKLGDLEDRVEDFSDRLDEFLMDRVN